MNWSWRASDQNAGCTAANFLYREGDSELTEPDEQELFDDSFADCNSVAPTNADDCARFSQDLRETTAWIVHFGRSGGYLNELIRGAAGASLRKVIWAGFCGGAPHSGSWATKTVAASGGDETGDNFCTQCGSINNALCRATFGEIWHTLSGATAACNAASGVGSCGCSASSNSTPGCGSFGGYSGGSSEGTPGFVSN